MNTNLSSNINFDYSRSYLVDAMKFLQFTKFLALIFIVYANLNLFAQSNSDYQTDEIVVSGSRYEEKLEIVNQAISIIPNEVLETTSPINMSYALMGNVGLWMQQTNHGSGSPFLRGLTGNQTLIMIDGIRLNNSIFRYGPNQYLNTINVNDIQRIEVLRGSGSVQYGSDAMGGVVHILTKTPKIGLSKQFSTGLQLKYLSDDMEKSVNTFIDYSTSNNAYHASISFNNYGNLVAGNNLGKESPSSYDEYSFNFKSIHRVSDKLLLSSNYQYLQQNDIDRFDQVNQRGYEYYKFDPQIRQLAYARGELYPDSDLAQRVTLTLSLQQSFEIRKNKKVDNNFRTKEKDVVDIVGANFLLLTKIGENWTINSGIDYYYDYVESNSSTFNVSDNFETKRRGLYSNGSKSHNLSIFTLSNLKFQEYEITIGGRYNYASLIINDDLFGRPKITPDALTGHLAFSYNAIENVRIIAKVNTAYRIPNINDLSSFGLFDYGIEVPNTNLLPETSINYEIGIKHRSAKIRTSLFVFRNDLSNLIDRVRSTYNDELFYNGEEVYTKINSGNAFIQGFEFDIKYVLSSDLIVMNNMTYSYGQNKSKNEPMRRIPPLNGTLSINYNLIEFLSLRLDYLFALKQNRLSSGDLDDHRISNDGTPGWGVINVYTNHKFGDFYISVGINNIFNEAYRMHGSGIDGMGRSIQFIGRYIY